ncbi:MAG: PepSY-associated TM helix domain-containing protein, partial [Planctomycetota bacterium]
KSAAFFRWFHIYVSMVCFGTMIFFSLTGITLNHPTWFGASDFQIEDKSGQLPTELLAEPVDKLAVAEKLRADYRLKGAVKEFEIDEFELMVVFKGPGYAADIFIDRESGRLDLSESKAGFVAIMNDLHKGRDTGAKWSWVIDLSAAFVLLAGFSGFGLLFYVKRRRASGLWASFWGTVVLVLIWAFFVP